LRAYPKNIRVLVLDPLQTGKNPKFSRENKKQKAVRENSVLT
jgi:hypothetical protein